jgi:ABC-type branched-subunit amino acid transport system substrate-binding protein
MCRLHVNCHTSGVLALASSNHRMRDTAPLRELFGGSMRYAVRRISQSLAICTVAAASLTVASGTAIGATSKAPIVVGGVWSASTYAGTDIGAEAAFKAFNASGGLDGRMIKFIGMQDDAQSNTQNLTATKNLINDHVFAVVPVATSSWVSGPLLAKANIPYFGMSINTNWWGENNAFSVIGSNPPSPTTLKTETDSVAVICKAVPGGCHGKTVAIIATNDSAAKENAANDAAQFRRAGAKVVAEQSSIPDPPAVVSDYTPYADQLMSANSGKQPNIIQQVLPPTADVAMIAELRNLGFKGTDFNFSLYDPRAVSVAKGSDTLVTFEPWEANTPAVNTMKQRVLAFDPKASLGQPTLIGYYSAELFIAALKKAGPNATSQSMTKALNSGFTFGVPGGIGTTTYPQDHHAVSTCLSVVTSDGKAYKVAVPLTCPALIPNPLYKP